MAAAAGACARGPAVASRPECAASWRAEWSADSAAALCVPPGFARLRDRPATWRREHDGLVQALLAVHVDLPTAWERGEIADRWPPALPPAGPCTYADCVMTDSLVAHVDTVAGVAVRVETGLLTGGAVGMRRHPTLVAGWDAPGARRVYVSGLADAPATLDTLRAALRTLRITAR